VRLSITFGAAVVAAVALTAPTGAQARTVAATATPSPAAAPSLMPAGSYDFTRVDDDGDTSSGTVSWSGQLMRVQIDRSRSRRTNSRTGSTSTTITSGRDDYMLVDFANNTVRQVKPASREVNEMPMATFEQIIGKALGMVGTIVQMQVRDAGIIAKEVGPGGEVAGVPTRQFRMIEEYNVRIGVFGMNAEEKHHRVVTDYWVPTDAGVPRNPMFELLTRSASATAQQDAGHQANVARARAALFRGAPIKATVVVTEAGESPKRSQIEVTSLSSATPAEALFTVPQGYRVKRNDLSFSL
jgi:hypothetical protein